MPGDSSMAPLVDRMVDRLARRGPDSRGTWTGEAGGPAFGHTRLAIVDLSEQGHQPMHSASGRYTITYNGELYNQDSLRRELGERPWRGHSDTETLLEAIETWGIRRTLDKMVGMFAFALWDRAERRLVLARDRLGEKPLYVAHTSSGIAFASEIKALRCLPSVDLGMDQEGLALYLQLGYVPAPLSIHRGIRKLLSAHLATYEQGVGLPRVECYWHGPGEASAIDEDTDEGALERFGALLRQSVQGQLLGDVPVGAFLSGGVDSSLVAATMQAASTQPIRTFSIGFAEAEFDESVQARAVAQHIGSRHTELHVTADDALALVPQVAGIYDEPFADSSAIPTLLLAKMTREHVKVALSGDGGDELFGGYNRHMAAARLWDGRKLPQPLRRLAAGAMTAVPSRWWDASVLTRRDPARTTSALGEKVHKLAGFIGADSVEQAYRSAIVHWDATGILRRHVEPVPLPPAPADSAAERMMRWDIRTYLPDDILVKVDRASMHHGLEARTPLLDHRIVEFALTQPLSRKIRGGCSKWLMRQQLYRHVPQSLIERPKMGFTLPMDRWLRGPLRGWAEDMLSPRALARTGLLDVATVRATWEDHLSGWRNRQQRLWNLLVFQSWLEGSPS